MAESDIGWPTGDSEDEMMLTYDKERDGVLPPQQAVPDLLNRRRSGLFGALETRVDQVLAADEQADLEGRTMVASLLAGKKLVDVSGADVAAGAGADRVADEPLGAAIDRLIVRHNVVGKMKE